MRSLRASASSLEDRGDRRGQALRVPLGVLERDAHTGARRDLEHGRVIRVHHRRAEVERLDHRAARSLPPGSGTRRRMRGPAPRPGRRPAGSRASAPARAAARPPRRWRQRRGRHSPAWPTMSSGRSTDPVWASDRMSGAIPLLRLQRADAEQVLLGRSSAAARTSASTGSVSLELTAAADDPNPIAEVEELGQLLPDRRAWGPRRRPHTSAPAAPRPCSRRPCAGQWSPDASTAQHRAPSRRSGRRCR